MSSPWRNRLKLFVNLAVVVAMVPLLTATTCQNQNACNPTCPSGQSCVNGVCKPVSAGSVVLVEVDLVSQGGFGPNGPIGLTDGGCLTTVGITDQTATAFVPAVGKDVVVTVTGSDSTDSRPQVRVFRGSTTQSFVGPLGQTVTTPAFQPVSASEHNIRINECNAGFAPAGSSYHIKVVQAQ